jgi:hypothetical protein
MTEDGTVHIILLFLISFSCVRSFDYGRSGICRIALHRIELMEWKGTEFYDPPLLRFRCFES